MRKLIKKSVKKLYLLLIIVILIELAILGVKPHPNFWLKRESLAQYAAQVIKKCSSSKYHPNCYNEEVPKLMTKISMEDAFKVTSFIQDKDSSFGYCHVLSHKLSSLEVDKNPDKWMDVLPRCPANGMCANGCLHGALQERFRVESLSADQIEKAIPDLKVACEARAGWNPTGLDQAICYHGLGHLTMYITNSNFKKALELCNRIAKKDGGRNFTGVCYEGLFMQLFQPLEPEDFALVKGKTPEQKNLLSFCSQFETKSQQQACWEEGFPLYREEIKTAKGIVNFCMNSPNQYAIDHCFDMLFTALGQAANFDASIITEVCRDIPEGRRGQCFANGALSMIQADKKFIDRATGLCSRAQPFQVTQDCYNKLADMALYNFHSGTEELNRFCSKLPENLYDKCFGNHPS